MPEYVCNVDTWGASPSYHQGDIIPEDCPYDVEAAAKQRKVVPVDQYKQLHPEWDPEAEAKAKAEAELMATVYPGRDTPTAADMPDPKAEAAMYADAAKAEADAEPKPVQVQQGSAPRSGGGSSSRSSS